MLPTRCDLTYLQTLIYNTNCWQGLGKAFTSHLLLSLLCISEYDKFVPITYPRGQLVGKGAKVVIERL